MLGDCRELHFVNSWVCFFSDYCLNFIQQTIFSECQKSLVVLIILWCVESSQVLYKSEETSDSGTQVICLYTIQSIRNCGRRWCLMRWWIWGAGWSSLGMLQDFHNVTNDSNSKIALETVCPLMTASPQPVIRFSTNVIAYCLPAAVGMPASQKKASHSESSSLLFSALVFPRVIKILLVFWKKLGA